MSSRFVAANGLTHHVIEEGAGEPVLLLHGYLDLARSFGRVIDLVAGAGFRVVAPDFRGHGDSDRAPAGSYYHFPDYVADVAGLLDALGLARVRVVAHSMGGSVATLLAGALPERVVALALLEGVGPPAHPADVAPDRSARWLAEVARVRARAPRRYASLDEVTARMGHSHPDVAPATLRAMAEIAARRVEGVGAGAGGWEFRFDPLHQTTAPGRFDAAAFEAFIDRIRCPVLLVDGGSAAAFPDLAARAGRYAGARTVTLPGAGHMMHWTQPDALAAAVLAFLGS